MVPGQAYMAHEIQSANGTVIREYASPSGKVFAVSWRGPWMPDMHQLLGQYFEQYSQAMQSQSGTRMRRGPLRIELPGLVVTLGGRPRSYVGRAYLPNDLPEGVRAEDLQ